jgi:hypothetical protein
MSSTNLMHCAGLATILVGVLCRIALFVPSSPSMGLEHVLHLRDSSISMYRLT